MRKAIVLRGRAATTRNEIKGMHVLFVSFFAEPGAKKVSRAIFPHTRHRALRDDFGPSFHH